MWNGLQTTPAEFDQIWEDTKNNWPNTFSLMIDTTCSEMEERVTDVLTWEQLAPFYGREA